MAAGKRIRELTQVGTLLTSADIIVVQNNLTQRTNVLEIMRLLTDSTITEEEGLSALITEETVQATVDSSLTIVNTNIQSNTTAITANAVAIQTVDTNTDTRLDAIDTILGTTSLEWDAAYLWGNHAAAGYESSANKAIINGYASLDGSATIPLIQIPTLTASKLPTITRDLLPAILIEDLPTITRAILPAILVEDLPTLTEDLIPTLTGYAQTADIYWQTVDHTTDITDFNLDYEYRVQYINGDTSKTIAAYPYKIENTRMYFTDFYMASDGKSSLTDYSDSNISTWSVNYIQRRLMGVIV